MSVSINFYIGDGQLSDQPGEQRQNRINDSDKIASDVGVIKEQISGDTKPFPKARLGGYMSHFQIVLEIDEGKRKRLVSVVSPLAAQTVSWSDPFIYKGPSAKHYVDLIMPRGSDLPQRIHESDFLNWPAEFFQIGRETMWLQILNLDARMDTDIGPMRIILGETLKREYPDLFRPSLGVAQSHSSVGGFPASLYFNPYAIVETPIGTFRAVHGTLTYGRVTQFPPVGTPVTIASCIPLEPIDEVRAAREKGASEDTISPMGRIIALSHPIDMEVQLSGEEIFRFVEDCIDGKYVRGPRED